MFTLPSLWNIIISTIAFFMAVWYLRRYFDRQEMPRGMTRSLLIFMLAYVVSWGAGTVVDWIQTKIEGPQQSAPEAVDLDRLLKAAGRIQE